MGFKNTERSCSFFFNFGDLRLFIDNSCRMCLWWLLTGGPGGETCFLRNFLLSKEKGLLVGGLSHSAVSYHVYSPETQSDLAEEVSAIGPGIIP